jgi:hypothetical protein
VQLLADTGVSLPTEAVVLSFVATIQETFYKSMLLADCALYRAALWAAIGPFYDCFLPIGLI